MIALIQRRPHRCSRFSLAGMLALTAGLSGGGTAPWAGAQAVPLRTQGWGAGFSLPDASGTLTYSLTLSDGVSLGYNGSNQTTNSTDISGNLAYLSHSRTQPFSVIYSGGYLFGQNGQPSSLVQTLALSQVLKYHRFSVVLLDAVSYLPNNPVTGLSGVPGLGDQGLGQDSGSALLSNYGARLTNLSSVSASYSLTGRTSLSGTGSLTLLRLPGGNSSTGVESNTEGASGSISHRLNARTTLSGTGSYSHFSYLGLPTTYDSQGASLDVSRQWTAHLATEFSAGPQNTTTTGEPDNLNYSLTASAVYQLQRVSIAASFVRATNSGSGVTAAARSNSANLSASRRLGNFVRASAFTSFSTSTPLPTMLVIGPQQPVRTLVAGGQVSRAIMSNLSAYASYTLQRQIVSNDDVTVNALNGVQQSFGFGVTYSPRPKIFR